VVCGCQTDAWADAVNTVGLDPNGHELLSKLLDRISTPGKDASSTPVVLGLRPQDPVPEWSTHLLYVDNDAVISQGEKRDVVSRVKELGKKILLEGEDASEDRGVVERAWAGIGSKAFTSGTYKTFAEPLVEMQNIRIAYFGKVILDDFSWTIRRGEKWGLFGPNGSGKTTITSLLTSDHPLTYSLPIKHFSRPRLPQPGKPGISVFEVQSKIGISSPELHSFFPRHLSLRRCIESGFAETFVSQPKISPQEREHVGAVLDEFKDLIPGGDWKVCFGDADMSTQRLALFLRAVAPKRDIVIFDEAFSGMRKEVRERCFRFLGTEKGWDERRQAMVVVSHISEEVPPGVERWVRLGEKGGKEKAVFGEL
jgi:ABC-type molybdenum transport system ATPase subunit/photorepair protein PhrA